MLNTEPKLSDIPTDEILPGGSDPNDFDFNEAWYPTHYVQDLDKSKPTPFTLLGRDLVIWWDKLTESWKIFSDECPHRLARLSEGRISDDGLLECPYHGWAFSGDGSCQRIPQQVEGGAAENSKRACVGSLPTIERQGLLFVYGGNPENAAKTKVPIIEPLEESPEDWVVINTFRDVPYDALTLLENILDPSHISFTHHRTVGNRANAAPIELEVVESGKHGFYGTWKEEQKQDEFVKRSTTFVPPSLAMHDISQQRGRILTVVYATPIRKGECRLFARFPFKFPNKLPSLFINLRPRWYYHIGQNGVLEDDQIFLHYQERYLEAKGGSPNFSKAFYLPTKADTFVFELHQWVNQYNAKPFGDESLPTPLSQERLLERYYSHTVNCASCRNALAKIQQLQLWCGAIALVTLASTPLVSLLFDIKSVLGAMILTVIPLGFAIAWLRLGKLVNQFYEGRVVPPRNLPEK
ncbi:Rieske 2Fe-2S domain-containing protein [Aetokthonos hydrillicola Thurmond2011]|jgi:phenylpropionate dioxygenase-like ring-hydroxylating dioxygenase large terminal subunit|uniref:Rieske 2Fe-2S domain-containing protein n=1 Tax=Aetokthonos hydrillicola Thurmond2011 TaxID=2712845 RepID=A0AAP5M8L0_9CYAN|nr:Rieske 2Fe-2S domain-containing protein [Aetokthonos hydrillicola]MBO3463908.1 Rieske 2Fe-2S domain-containing protein [Aetokthonos hydrillicola CCALA 1050]MBW4590214.1 Rieske 2Fe-2S domain-containing protein [Aetokthonos hydrillicola CCALA 1050]MDR9893359.1 Rieske 2Fe-2S domain-containing protein [Aetokthonos hydrillicola Thurmond2011]